MSSRVNSNNFSPKTGYTDSNAYLTSIFKNDLECNSIPELIEIMKQEELAPVKNRRTGEVKVSSGRHVRRITFDSDTVESLLPLVNSDLDKILEPGDYNRYVELSHCDLLFYDGNEQGHHDFHTDEVPPNPGTYKYHSLIICLSSKISSSDDGATIVEVDGKKITYPSNRKDNFLLFPAENRHCVLPVRSRKTSDKNAWFRVERNNRRRLVHIPVKGDSGEYVLKLKFDVWVYDNSDFQFDEDEERAYQEYLEEDDDWCNGYDCYPRRRSKRRRNTNVVKSF